VAQHRTRTGEQDAALVVPGGVDPPAHLPDDLFHAAVGTYLAGQRLDMQALAARLGVGRATLYRKAGNREQLLDEILWWRARQAITDAVIGSARTRGVPRLVSVITTIMRGIENDRSLRALLDADPEGAMRLLTGSRGTAQRGIAGALEKLIELEVARGSYATELDAPTLAFTILRITEGFLYADIIADRTPDVDRASDVIGALLRGLDTTRRR
jgi:AcrR family transcriptional regulator